MAREFDFAQGVCVESTPIPIQHMAKEEDLDKYLCEMADWYEQQQWGQLVCHSDSLDKSIRGLK